MASSLPLFPTAVIGSMPRPQYVKDLFATGSRTGEGDDRWRQRMDEAYAKLKSLGTAAQPLRQTHA